MMIRSLIFFLMAIPLLVVSACSGVPSEASVDLSCDDFTNNHHIKREVEVASGGIVTVILCENRTTGFQWPEIAQITNTTVLEQTGGGGYMAAESGAAGNSEWTFKALKEGTSKVSLEYSQDWSGGLKAEWTFELTVTVK